MIDGSECFCLVFRGPKESMAHTSTGEPKNPACLGTGPFGPGRFVRVAGRISATPLWATSM